MSAPCKETLSTQNHFYLQMCQSINPFKVMFSLNQDIEACPPDTSLLGSWRDTCRSPRCWHGDQQGVLRHPRGRRRGATPCEQTENEALGSGESPEPPGPSSAPHETPRSQSGRAGSFPVRRRERLDQYLINPVPIHALILTLAMNLPRQCERSPGEVLQVWNTLSP